MRLNDRLKRALAVAALAVVSSWFGPTRDPRPGAAQGHADRGNDHADPDRDPGIPADPQLARHLERRRGRP